ncbi:MAG: phage major capsid protein [Pseudomonadota bacterium]
MGNMARSADFRGIASVRADASDANKILADLHKAFHDFKAENDERLKGKADVVVDEKIDRMNGAITDFQSALDDVNAKLASISINANAVGGGNSVVVDSEYTESFNAYFRNSEIRADLRKSDATQGGYFTPIEWDRTVIDKLVRVSPMRSVASQITISTAGFSKVVNQKGTTSGWAAEAAARNETNTPALGSISFIPHEIFAMPAATQVMLDDALIDVESWLAGEVEQEFAFQEGIAFVSGDGSNKPNGILTYVTGGANAAVHPYGAITTVDSGAAAGLTGDGIINLVYDLPSEFTANARFAMNRNTERAARLLKDGDGNYLWQPSYQAGAPATMAGYPLTEMAAMPDLAAGSKSVLFGDFQRTYLVVDRSGISVLRDPYTAKGFVRFYTVKRVGGGLLNPEPMRALNTAA